ncbi:MAG: RtcB family protein [Pirellulaceae bacterium]|nr:RtcB family protein [Pirellulaceae bacterium]
MSKNASKGKLRTWLTEPLTKEVSRSLHRLVNADDVQRIVVMPDVHLAADVCVGAVLATSQLIYPAAVGGDIGCGMAAVRVDGEADLLHGEQAASLLLSALYSRVPTNRHSRDTAPHALPTELGSISLNHPSLDRRKHRDGRVQLGTLGRGNHFLEFQADQEGQLWFMVHSGSRAMGQAITDYHLSQAETGFTGLKYLDSETIAGQDYLHDMEWALRYAERNRLCMARTVARLLHDLFGVETDWTSLIHGHHNHVVQEKHLGETLWVHRKGAQSSRRNEAGIIPGSMGTASFLVSGRGCQSSLCSSSHGAGRKLSRGKARQAISTSQLHRQMRRVRFDHRKASVLREEAPEAYKDIYAVMRAQKELTRITAELKPVLCYKGH